MKVVKATIMANVKECIEEIQSIGNRADVRDWKKRALFQADLVMHCNATQAVRIRQLEDALVKKGERIKHLESQLGETTRNVPTPGFCKFCGKATGHLTESNEWICEPYASKCAQDIPKEGDKP